MLSALFHLNFTTKYFISHGNGTTTMSMPVFLFTEMDAPMIGLCAVAVLVAVMASAEFPPGTYILPLALYVALNLAIMLVTHGVIARAGGRRRA
jgi:hypothetical protein